LTTDIDFTLFGRDAKDNSLITLAESQWFNELQSDTSIVSSRQGITIQRLRVKNLKDVLSSDQSLSTNFLLRLKFSKRMRALIQSIRQRSIISDNDEVCFTFEMSIRVS